MTTLRAQGEAKAFGRRTVLTGGSIAGPVIALAAHAAAVVALATVALERVP